MAAKPSDSAALNAAMEAVGKRRDREAFQLLFDHFAPRLKTYLMRLGAGAPQADDLVQETMLAIWRKAALFDPAKGSAVTWVFTVARNLRIDAIRRERRPELDPNDPMLLPEPAPEADAAMTFGEAQDRIRLALRDLSPEQMQVVEQSFFADKSHGVIARELGLPLGTVKSRLRLALARLRAAMGDTPMSVTHHPGEELLLAYASGAADEAVALIVATHLAFCSLCRAVVRDAEEVGGALLDDLAPSHLDVRLRASVLARLDDEPAPHRKAPVAGDVPAPLRAYIGENFSAVRWRPVAPGLAHRPLFTRGAVRAQLIRSAPGAAVAMHTHLGEELTLVLTGAFSDSTGRYEVGDLQSTTPEITHRPTALDGPVCINLAVTDAPLVFEGALPKLVGKLFGF